MSFQLSYVVRAIARKCCHTSICLIPLTLCLLEIIPLPSALYPKGFTVLARTTSNDRHSEEDRFLDLNIHQFNNEQPQQAYLKSQRILDHDFSRLYAKSRNFTAQANNSPDHVYEQGMQYYRNSQFNEAIQMLQRALTMYQQSNNSSRECLAASHIGFAYANLGNFNAALEYQQQCLIIARAIDSLRLEALALYGLGFAYEGQGRTDEALFSYTQSLAIARQADARRTEAQVLRALGSIYNSLAYYAEAIDAYEQSLEVIEGINEIREQGRIQHDLGNLYLLSGNYAEAIDAYQIAIDIARQVPDRAIEASAFMGIGSVYSQLGDSSNAILYWRQSLTIAQAMNDEGLTLTLLQLLGEASPAEVIERASINGDRSTEMFGWISQGIEYLNNSIYDQSFLALQQSLIIAQDIGEREREGDIFHLMGFALEQQDNKELAIIFYKKSVNIREEIRGDISSLPIEFQQSYVDSVSDTYRRLADLLLSQGRIIEAQQVLELLKLEELREFTRSARGLESDEGIPLNTVEAEILEEFGTLVAFGKQLYECEQTRCAQLAEYRQQRQAQSTRFDAQVTAFIQTIRDNRQNDDFFYDPRYLNETARDIVAQPGTLLIYPFVTEDQVWLLYTAAGDVAGAIPVPVSQLELGNAVVRFRDLLESPHSDVVELQATGKQLYDWLIAPLEAEIQASNITTLVFSQDRVTRYIPMAALWDGEQYLAQRYPLFTILSAELTDMGDRLSPDPAETRVFALGLSAAVLDFDPLPNVESELDMVVRVDERDATGIYPGMQLLNAEFNRDGLFRNLFGHRIIHIATHGKFVAGQPEESFLVLGDGNLLSIPEINSIGSDLRDVHLVVLSACETAVGGPTADGIEVAGISSYFLAANRASAVMASLWLVNDASTSLLMQQFYANLAAGMTKAEALRQAQLALLNGDIDPALVEALSRSLVQWEDVAEVPENATTDTLPDLSHPYYWAPFILIGNGL